MSSNHTSPRIKEAALPGEPPASDAAPDKFGADVAVPDIAVDRETNQTRFSISSEKYRAPGA
jgi:hypothetical protein